MCGLNVFPFFHTIWESFNSYLYAFFSFEVHFYYKYQIKEKERYNLHKVQTTKASWVFLFAVIVNVAALRRQSVIEQNTEIRGGVHTL